MKYIPLFGLAAGGVVAAGRLTTAQWQQIGQTVLALALHYGLLMLPWLLALFFALLWWRQRDITTAFREGYLEKVMRPVPRRKRGTR